MDLLSAHLSKALMVLTLFVACTTQIRAEKNDLILQQPNVSLALANQLIDATMAACHVEGRFAVVAVVDRAGNLIALQRDDQVGPHNTDAAVRKAFTALSTKTPTLLLATNARANADSNNLNTVKDLLLIGGGVPLKVGNEVIGAMGVGGSGGAIQDESCALKAIAQVLPLDKTH